MLSTAVPALAAAIALGCGVGDAASEPTPGAGASARRVDLTIAIAASARAGAPKREWHLRCGPAGGDWPSRSAACRRLESGLLAPIGPEPRDLVAITHQPVDVSGRAFGKKVALRFPAKGSSKRRARYRQLRAALGESAFATAEKRSR